MKYYQFVFPFSRKIFGTQGNVRGRNSSEDTNLFYSDKSYYENQFLSFHFLKGKEDKIFVPKYMEKGPSSKLTNMLWVEGETRSLVIDDAMMKVLKVLNSFGLLFFETSLVYKGSQPLKYWYIVPRHEAVMCIDYDKTILIEQPDMFDKGTWKYLSFNNADEMEKYERINKVLLHKDNLSISSDCNCDFFALRNVFTRPVGYIVSERLREKIENEKMTGMQFLEFTEKWP